MLKIDKSKIAAIELAGVATTAMAVSKGDNRGTGRLYKNYTPVFYCPVTGFSVHGHRAIGNSENSCGPSKQAIDPLLPANIGEERRASMVRSIEAQSIISVDLVGMTMNNSPAKAYHFLNKLRTLTLGGIDGDTLIDKIEKFYASYDGVSLDTVQPGQDARNLANRLTMALTPRQVYKGMSAMGYHALWRECCNRIFKIRNIEGTTEAQRLKAAEVFLATCQLVNISPIQTVVDLLQAA
jgi:hypothetical protein